MMDNAEKFAEVKAKRERETRIKTEEPRFRFIKEKLLEIFNGLQNIYDLEDLLADFGPEKLKTLIEGRLEEEVVSIKVAQATLAKRESEINSYKERLNEN